jgi:hypothetical protein
VVIGKLIPAGTGIEKRGARKSTQHDDLVGEITTMLEAGADRAAGQQPPQLETPDEVQQARSVLGMEMDDEALSAALQSPRNAEDEEIKRRLEELLSGGDSGDNAGESAESEESGGSAESDAPESTAEALLEEQPGNPEASNDEASLSN